MTYNSKRVAEIVRAYQEVRNAYGHFLPNPLDAKAFKRANEAIEVFDRDVPKKVRDFQLEPRLDELRSLCRSQIELTSRVS